MHSVGPKRPELREKMNEMGKNMTLVSESIAVENSLIAVQYIEEYRRKFRTSRTIEGIVFIYVCFFLSTLNDIFFNNQPFQVIASLIAIFGAAIALFPYFNWMNSINRIAALYWKLGNNVDRYLVKEVPGTGRNEKMETIINDWSMRECFMDILYIFLHLLCINTLGVLTIYFGYVGLLPLVDIVVYLIFPVIFSFFIILSLVRAIRIDVLDFIGHSLSRSRSRKQIAIKLIEFGLDLLGAKWKNHGPARMDDVLPIGDIQKWYDEWKDSGASGDVVEILKEKLTESLGSEISRKKIIKQLAHMDIHYEKPRKERPLPEWDSGLVEELTGLKEQYDELDDIDRDP